MAAQAATATDEPSVKVSKVVRKSSSKAIATLKMKCAKGESFSFATEVLQDSTPEAAPLDAYYTSSSLREGRCSGRSNSIRITTVADTSGDFAPEDGRLRKGSAEVVISLTVGDDMFIETSTVKVR